MLSCNRRFNPPWAITDATSEEPSFSFLFPIFYTFIPPTTMLLLLSIAVVFFLIPIHHHATADPPSHQIPIMINHDNSSSTTATAPPWKPKPAAPPTTETSLLHPFTAQWIQLMEQFYNALGGHDHSSYKQNHCPIQLPEFKCETFYWDDGRHESRDAKHLRPHVSFLRLTTLAASILNDPYHHAGY